MTEKNGEGKNQSRAGATRESPELLPIDQQLRESLDIATWGHQKCAQASLQLNHRLNPLSILQRAQGDWCVYWRPKNQQKTVVAFGALLTFSELPNLTVDHWGWGVFGGMAFDQGRLLAPVAPELTTTQFWLPVHEWVFTEEGITLTVRVLVPEGQPGAPEDAVLPALMDQVSAALQKISRVVEPEKSLTAPKRVTETPDRDYWAQVISKAQARILRHDLEKVVLGRCRILEFDEKPALSKILEGLQKIEEPSYLMAFQTPSGVAFLSRSPEKLLSWRGPKFDVDALAGTRKRSNDVKEDLTAGAQLSLSPKETAEHRAVTQYIEEILTPYCESLTQVEKERLLLLKNVQHLYSRFSGQCLPQYHPLEILKKLHPTPAVGGRPKELATAFLAAAEGFERGWFAGAVGWTDGFEGDFAIGIRSAYLYGNELKIFAGCGIMAESDPEAEWQETSWKMKNFNDLFQVDSKAYDRVLSDG